MINHENSPTRRAMRSAAGTPAYHALKARARAEESTMTEYVARDRDGKELHSGDTVINFRGERETFVSITRGPEYNGTAKVILRDAAGYEAERYAGVADITVTAVSAVTVPGRLASYRAAPSDTGGPAALEMTVEAGDQRIAVIMDTGTLRQLAEYAERLNEGNTQ